jgi:uncharacterized protein
MNKSAMSENAMNEITIQLLYVSRPNEGARAYTKTIGVLSGITLETLLASEAVRRFCAECGADLLDNAKANVSGTGVWGRVRSIDYVLRDADRVEFYRPLQADPKEARRRKATATPERKIPLKS